MKYVQNIITNLIFRMRLVVMMNYSRKHFCAAPSSPFLVMKSVCPQNTPYLTLWKAPAIPLGNRITKHSKKKNIKYVLTQYQYQQKFLLELPIKNGLFYPQC